MKPNKSQFEPWDPSVKQLNTVSAETVTPGSWEGEPLRHISVEDHDSAKKSAEKYNEGHAKFDRGEIKTTNEMF